MRRVNISQPEFTFDPADPDGFRGGVMRLGRVVGAAETGASVYELPPGEALCPYHYEHGEEEWLLVLAGRPLVRHPGGEERLDPWDVVFFPKGPDGAHGIRNDGDEPVRLLMFSNLLYPAVTVYPDSDKIGVWTKDGVDNVIVRRASGVDYYEGESG